MASLKRTEKFLIAPMDWGLGHATRCIPIINQLLQKKFEVLLAGSGDSLKLLQATYPDLSSFQLPAYNPVYPEGKAMVWTMGRQLPHFIRVIQQEHKAIHHLIEKHRVDYLISDNRYGCFSNKIPSVFIGHQLRVLMPAGWKWMEPIVNAFNTRQLQKFSCCWVPAPGPDDFPELMHNPDLRIPVTYIGYLSRFKHQVEKPEFDVTVIASGPEPQRSKFVQQVATSMTPFQGRICIIKGDAKASTEPEVTSQSTTYGYLTGEALNRTLSQSSIIIARSGYSTVMDLMHTGGKAILVPTPNQTEQEYIAARLNEKRIAFSIEQDKLDLLKALHEVETYVGFKPIHAQTDLLDKAIDAICLKN